MMKKITSCLVFFAVLVFLIPCQKVTAMTPIPEYRYEYSAPQDFIHWLTDKEWASTQPYFDEDVYNKYWDAYWQKQGYVVVPQRKGKTLDKVRWSVKKVSVRYTYSNDWSMYVYPIKAVRNEDYFSTNISALVEKKNHCSVPSEYESPVYSMGSTNPVRIKREYYKIKKLRLGDDSVVDCVEHMRCDKDEYGNWGQYDLYFFVAGMYVEVSTGYRDNAKNPTADLRNCTFEKIYLTAQLEHDKQGNKVTKKNAILYATMHNPDNWKMSDINLYFYDKKARKYKLQYSKKVSTKNRAKKNLSIKLNVNSCLKKGRKQLKRKQVMKLKRKTRYKYIIRVKMSGGYLSTDKTSLNRKYYDVKGSFKLK